MDKQYSGLQKAVQAAGGVAPLARFLKLPHKVLHGWLSEDGTKVPTDVRQHNAELERAIQLAGSQAALARKLGVSSQVIVQWVRQGYVPSRRAQEIENNFGVPRTGLLSPKLRSSLGIGGDL